MHDLPSAPVLALTGATGFIGRRLVPALALAGWRVRLLLRRDPVVPEWRSVRPQVVAGALDDSRALERLVGDAQVVIHLAGLIKAARGREFFAVNRDGAAALARATARVAPHACFLLVSSLAAREPQLSDYAASKRAGEDAVRGIIGSRATILRPTAVYGPGDRETLAFFQLARLAWIPLLASKEARGTLIHVDDLVSLIVALVADVRRDAVRPLEMMRHTPGDTTPPDVTSRGARSETAPQDTGPSDMTRRDAVLTATDDRPDGYSWTEIFAAAARAVGNSRPRLFHAPAALLRAVAYGGDLGRLIGAANMLNSQKLRELRHPDWTVSPAERALAPGWSPRFTLDAGFADAVTWYRAAGWLP